MASALTAFLGGAATQATSMIETEKKNAKDLAAAQASTMLKTYMEVDKQSKELSNKMAADVEFMKAYYPEASDDDLVEAAKNPEAMAVFKKRAQEADFDPTIIKFADFVTVASKNTGKDFKTQINELYDIKKAEAAPVKAAENLSWAQRLTAGTGEAELNRIVSPLGVTPDQLRAAMTYKPSVTSTAKFNLGALSQKTFDAEYDKVKLEVVKAQQLPTGADKDVALKVSTQKLAQFTLVKSLGSTEALTNEKILSNMVTEIQGLSPDSPERKALEKKLTERKALMKTGTNEISENDIRTDLTTRIIAAKKNKNMPEAKALTAELEQRKKLLDKEETDVEKITATNLQVAASRAIVAAITTNVPAGSFTITTNADGSQTTSVTSMTKTADYDRGVNAGRQAVFEKYTENGVPRSEAHALALLSIGFVIDKKSGIARLPANPRVATPSPEAPAKPAAPAPAAPAPAAPAPAPAAPAPAPAAPAPAPAAPAPAKPPPAAQKLPTPKEFDDKWATLKPGQTIIGPDGKTYTKGKK